MADCVGACVLMSSVGTLSLGGDVVLTSFVGNGNGFVVVVGLSLVVAYDCVQVLLVLVDQYPNLSSSIPNTMNGLMSVNRSCNNGDFNFLPDHASTNSTTWLYVKLLLYMNPLVTGVVITTPLSDNLIDVMSNVSPTQFLFFSTYSCVQGNDCSSLLSLSNCLNVIRCPHVIWSSVFDTDVRDRSLSSNCNKM